MKQELDPDIEKVVGKHLRAIAEATQAFTNAVDNITLRGDALPAGNRALTKYSEAMRWAVQAVMFSAEAKQVERNDRKDDQERRNTKEE